MTVTIFKDSNIFIKEFWLEVYHGQFCTYVITTPKHTILIFLNTQHFMISTAVLIDQTFSEWGDIKLEQKS
jgi:hypothetical protein